MAEFQPAGVPSRGIDLHGRPASSITDQTLLAEDNYIQRPGSELRLTLDSTGTKGYDYGLLNVLRTMDIKGGDLTVLLGNGFTPALGDTFDIFDFNDAVGAFDSLSLPALDPGLSWNTDMLFVDGTIEVVTAWLVGDLNLDGNIDGLDIDGFVLALTDVSAYATSVGLSLSDATGIADINLDGNVDGLDIDGFVALLTSGAADDGPRSGVVPEPATFALLGLGSLALLRRRAN